MVKSKAAGADSEAARQWQMDVMRSAQAREQRAWRGGSTAASARRDNALGANERPTVGAIPQTAEC